MIDDPAEPVKVELNANSDVAIIAFGGLRLREAVPPFEWGGLQYQVDAN